MSAAVVSRVMGRVSVVNSAVASQMPSTREQRIVAGALCTFIFWGLLASAMLFFFVIQYTGAAVNDVRSRYVAARAQQVASRMAKVLNAALAARDALDYAVQRKLYYDPLDSTAIQLALQPVMSAEPFLRSVDLGFDSRNESLTVHRHLAGGGLLVQSDEPDCFQKLGPLGCLSAQPARQQLWYRQGLGLPGGAAAEQSSDVTGNLVDSFDWVDSPGFVPGGANATGQGATLVGTDGDRSFGVPGDTGWSGGGCPAVAWASAYSLVFRSTFPGTGGALSVIGRVTLEVDQLSAADLLQTDRLGRQGAVYICDSSGFVVVAAQPGEQLFAIAPSGRLRFRRVWELSHSWAKDLRLEDFLAQEQQSLLINGFHVTLVPMTARGLRHFRTVVVAEKEPFVDNTLARVCTLAEVWVAMPYPLALLSACGAVLLRKFQRRQRLLAMRAAIQHGMTSSPPGSAKQGPKLTGRPQGLSARLRSSSSLFMRAFK